MSIFLLNAIQLSLCLSAMSLGIFITMKVFNIPDITTDGSYTLGASVAAILTIHHWTAEAALPISMLAGAFAGCCTGWVHTRLKIDPLLSGILVMTGLYSINLLILGRSNIPLLNTSNFFNLFHWFSSDALNGLTVSAVAVLLLIGGLTYLLNTDFGIAMRATGNNPHMTRSLGINQNLMKIAGLAIANSLTALSGFLVAQYQNFTDINMGIGIVITGLGTVLIADTLRGWFRTRRIGWQLLQVCLGSLIFQLILALTLSLGIDPTVMKLVTALFVLAIVGIPRLFRISGQALR